jgi:hypothetical protein
MGELDAACTAPTLKTRRVWPLLFPRVEEIVPAAAPERSAQQPSGLRFDEGLRPCSHVFRLTRGVRGNSRGDVRENRKVSSIQI